MKLDAGDYCGGYCLLARMTVLKLYVAVTTTVKLQVLFAVILGSMT